MPDLRAPGNFNCEIPIEPETWREVCGLAVFLICDGYRTDTAALIADSPRMSRYSFTLEDGVPVAPEDATEDFASNQAAMEHAKLIAKDLARSTAARNNLHVVVRNEAGAQIGDIAVLPERR